MRLTKARVAVFVAACLLVTVPLTALGLSADDDVPGAPLPSSAFTGELDVVAAQAEVRDVSDTYQVALAEGQWLYVSMTGSSGTDFDLYLFDPTSTSIDDGRSAVAFSEKQGTSSERILYRAPESGTYYLEVRAFEGKGTYRISHGSPAETPVVSASGPTTVAWGGKARISGSLTVAQGPLAGTGVQVWAKEYGSNAWKRAGATTTDADGRYSVWVKPGKKTAYQTRYFGGTRYLPARTTFVNVIPRASLTKPWAPTRVRARVAFTSTGYLKPRHKSRAKSVKLLCYRVERQPDGSSKYVLRKTFSAVNANYGTYTKYSARVTLPSRGKWKIVARIGADSIHAATTSSARYKTVY